MGTGNYIRDNIAFKYSTVWHEKKTLQQGFKRFLSVTCRWERNRFEVREGSLSKGWMFDFFGGDANFD